MNSVSIRLRLVFDGSNDKKVALSFPFANAASNPALVKALTQAIVTDGDIYAELPLASKSADFIVNTIIPVGIS